MGFNRRYLNEEKLRRSYKNGGRKAIFLLYSTADAILCQDQFASKVTDLFAQRLDEKTLSEKLASIFQCTEFEFAVMRKVNAHRVSREQSLAEAISAYPDEIAFLESNAETPHERVREILLKQL